MADNIQRSRGRGQGYKFDRGGSPTEFGPYIGVVKNNVDTIRSGRLQVYIEEFAGDDPENETLWRTVNYVPPFYGIVQQSGTDKGVGDYIGNPQSYGMWFTPPDLETKVICFFVGGDPDLGYYIGCIPEPGVSHMIPAVGAARKYELEKGPQESYFSDSKQLPVTEINIENEEIDENPKFYDQPRPVHSYVAGVMLQQGLINDTVRGPITSSSQRESPSSVYGISTPGRAATQGGITEDNVNEKINSNKLTNEDIKVVGRRGGHSFVMDDGNLEGFDNLIRIRTSKGHQITMSDDGDCFYIIHANGQTWLELGTEGTVDVYSTNSVNIRTQGDINLHADKNINMYAGENFNVKSKAVRINGAETLDLASSQNLTVYSEGSVGIKASTTMAINSDTGGWKSSGSLNFKGGRIDLNGSSSPPNVSKPTLLNDVTLPDTVFVNGKGWEVEEGKLTTIVTRAPTHEPYPYHNRGVEVDVSLDAEGASAIPVETQTQVAVESLADKPVTAPVTPAQVIKQNPSPLTVANLSTAQVTGLLSSSVAGTQQSANTYSVDKGVGKYGISPTNLEALGLIKAGTVSRYGGNEAVLKNVINSPTVWTGKYGVKSIDGLLGNNQIQDVLQRNLLNIGYDGLKKKGVLTGLESATQTAPLLQAAATLNPQSVVNWVNGQANAQITNKINQVAKNAQQAMNLLNTQGALGALGSLGFNIAGVIDTVSRNSVNSAVVNIIGNGKVPAPVFKPKERGSNFFGS